MVNKSYTPNLYILIILHLILFILLYSRISMGQVQYPLQFQLAFPFGLANPFPSFPQTGNSLSFNLFNNFSNAINPYGYTSMWGGISPLANQGFIVNPYVSAATYYAAALLPADVVGAWAGTWTSTSALISLSGDVSLTLVQATNDVAGTLLFLLADTVRLGCPVVGIIDVDLLTITGKGILAGKTSVPYEIVISAAVTGAVMEGEYVIRETLLGNIIEQGTITASKL